MEISAAPWAHVAWEGLYFFTTKGGWCRCREGKKRRGKGNRGGE